MSFSSHIHVPILRRSNVADHVANLTTRNKYRGVATKNSKRSEGASSGYIPLPIDVVCHIRTFARYDGVHITSCTSDTPLFYPSKSSTYQNIDDTLDLTYGSGDVSGHVFEDAITFGGFTVQSQWLRMHLSVIRLVMSVLIIVSSRRWYHDFWEYRVHRYPEWYDALLLAPGGPE